MKTTILVLASAFLLGACAGGNDSADGTAPTTCTPDLGKKTLPGEPGSSGGSGMDEVTSFGENPAGLKMYVHAPPSGGTPNAIILALHGCTQTAAAYVGAGWNDLADKQNLVIVYGEQTSTNNSEQCFRWWDATQITKGGGEAESLANMVTYAQSKYGTKRAFVTGLSAGGAMTTVMLAAYPELFEAGAIMSGLPYKCATSQIDAYTCMAGKTETPEQWAALVPKSSGGAVPRVSVWQGDSDYTVNQKNRDEIVKQWTQVNGISADSPVTTTVGPAKHDEHKDSGGVTRVESWTITGMGHGVALDAKSGCGTAAAYELDVGLCSTSHAAEFFLGTVPSSTSSSSSSSSGGSSGSSGASSNCH